jgi:hypothetical protein
MTTSDRAGNEERAVREWAKDVVRAVPAVHIQNTDAVPTFKRRADACIDRAAVLLALEHAAALAATPTQTGAEGPAAELATIIGEPNTEAGDYLEDDPEAWKALVEAVRRYGLHVAPLTARIGDGAFEVVAGSIAAYLADQHGVFIASRPLDAATPTCGLCGQRHPRLSRNETCPAASTEDGVDLLASLRVVVDERNALLEALRGPATQDYRDELLREMGDEIVRLRRSGAEVAAAPGLAEAITEALGPKRVRTEKRADFDYGWNDCRDLVLRTLAARLTAKP